MMQQILNRLLPLIERTEDRRTDGQGMDTFGNGSCCIYVKATRNFFKPLSVFAAQARESGRMWMYIFRSESITL